MTNIFTCYYCHIESNQENIKVPISKGFRIKQHWHCQEDSKNQIQELETKTTKEWPSENVIHFFQGFKKTEAAFDDLTFSFLFQARCFLSFNALQNQNLYKQKWLKVALLAGI